MDYKSYKHRHSNQSYHGVVRMSNHLPSTEADAYRVMTVIFGADGWWNEGDYQRVATILHHYPRLARQSFISYFNHAIPPLCCLLINKKANQLPPVVQAVYRLNPNAVVERYGKQGDTALHFACRYFASNEVIEFLVQRHSDALGTRNHYGQSPLDYLLLTLKSAWGTETRLSTLKLFLSYRPDLVTEKNPRGQNLLEAAFRSGCQLECLDYIARQFQSNAMTTYTIGQGTHMGTSEIHILRKLLPHLQQLKCEAGSVWSPYALETLLHCLADNTSLLEIEGLALPGNNDWNHVVFTHMLACNQAVRILRVRVVPARMIDATDLLRSLFQGLARNEALEELHVWGCHSSAPTSTLLVSSDDSNGATATPFSQSRLQRLRLTNCSLPSARLLEMTSLLSNLTELRLAGVSFVAPGQRALQRFDLTSTLVSLFNQHPNLEAFFLTNCSSQHLNLATVCQALKVNRILKRLTIQGAFNTEAKQTQLVKALQDSNTTLQVVGAISFGHCTATVAYQKIQYYLKLNKWGRSVARDASTKKQCFLQLIGNVHGNEWLSGMDKVRLQFGLLKEAPNLWSR